MPGLAPVVLAHLEALVGFDTQNPPRDLAADSPLFDWLSGTLGSGFGIELTDHGRGRISFFARRGTPAVLFNVHLDTVPVLPGARFPSLQMTLAEDRAWGRGVCDIKGAAACLIALAQESDAPLALLFTTDEEGGEGCCVAEFISAGKARGFRQVIVAEPTKCRAETRHRGYLSARGHFHGVSGHSSEARALADNALHRATRWAAGMLQAAATAEAAGERTCFNIGTLSGGVKSNVIADSADIFWSARLPGGSSNDAFMERALALQDAGHADWKVSFSGPPLPSGTADDSIACEFIRRHGLTPGAGLDFWTEASLFGAAGIPALVLGPGDIAQAHAVDEWVSLSQLAAASDIYRGIVNSHE